MCGTSLYRSLNCSANVRLKSKSRPYSKGDQLSPHHSSRSTTFKPLSGEYIEIISFPEKALLPLYSLRSLRNDILNCWRHRGQRVGGGTSNFFPFKIGET